MHDGAGRREMQARSLPAPAMSFYCDAMSFASRLTRAPRAFDEEQGLIAAALLADHPSELRELVAGAAGCSPYLSRLIERHGGWLNGILDGSPEAALAALLEDAIALPDEALKTGLREIKARVALLVALADLGGLWSLEDVTGALTDFADLATDRALRAMVSIEIARGKLDGNAGGAAGLAALAMGKMGARELNYSSDIDLIMVFDGAKHAGDDFQTARTALVRATRHMSSLLSEITSDGYVFRTDLRLRPDASVTPVCLSMDAAEVYYESVGRTWERAAYVKARAAAGDIPAGEAFLARLTPFVWRRYLDFAAIQDAHDMRLRIRAHKGFRQTLDLEGRNLKLGAGGIREIEFFTQTRQIISGGRDPDLRARGTVEGLDVLAKKGWVARDAADKLAKAYRAHREVEHRLQMIADAQTHVLPADAAGFARLAAFMDRDAEDLRREIKDRLADVHGLTEGFFAPQAVGAAPAIPEKSRAIVERWQSYPALRSSRAVGIFERLKPELLKRLERAAKPHEALEQFDRFLVGLPAGVRLFSLFEANPQLIDLIIDITATSPALARYLGRNAQVLDAVIGGSFFTPWPGAAALRETLAGHLSECSDYEDKLDAARIWAKEWHFRVGVHHLRGLVDAVDAGRQYADLAEAVLGALWEPVMAEFSRKHGGPPGRGAAVLGMGSLGAGQLSATSDLDVIVIYDAAGVEASDGSRPLGAREYYAKLTKAFMTALTVQTAEGALYEVDMRLRPTGRQGPVATSLASFEIYQHEEAWTWEHLALTRARGVAGEEVVGRDAEKVREEILAAPRKAAKVLADVAEMRKRLANEKPPKGVWDAKQGAGRLRDIDLLAQTAALLSGSPARNTELQLAAGVDIGWLRESEARILNEIHKLFWALQAAARLLTGTSSLENEMGEGGRAFLLRQTNQASITALREVLAVQAADAKRIIGAALSRAPAGR